ncbi:MAG: aldo/keto reductase [Ferrimicrobium sp.]
MNYRQLGTSGLTVSEIGLGCNNFGVRCGIDQSNAVIKAALSAGITFFDTADIYGGRGGSEEIVGSALSSLRDEVVIATKFGMDMGDGVTVRGSRRYIMRALEASLRRLNTDYIDLYQLHEPDPRTPIQETLSALDDAVRAGKVRYIGSSNLAAWQIVEAEFRAREGGTHRFISSQSEYSLLERSIEAEVLPACRHFGIGLLPYYPLASGLLTGKFRRNEPPSATTRLGANPDRLARADFDTLEHLTHFGADRDMDLIDLAFGFLLADRSVASVIAGATTPEQVLRNVATLEHPLDDPQSLIEVLA